MESDPRCGPVESLRQATDKRSFFAELYVSLLCLFVLNFDVQLLLEDTHLSGPLCRDNNYWYVLTKGKGLYNICRHFGLLVLSPLKRRKKSKRIFQPAFLLLF